MKTPKTINGILFSPFQWIAGGKALTIGLIFLLSISFIGYLSGTVFDGALDIHYIPKKENYLMHLYFQISTWIIFSILFFIFIRILSKRSARIIDILGTVALSQYPLILAALWGFTPFTGSIFQGVDPQTIDINILNSILKDNIVSIVLTFCIIIPIEIWTIVLKYKSYTICGNIKGSKAIISFIAIVLIAEILSKILAYLIL